MRPGLVSGVNVDRLDKNAGMAKAVALGYDDATSRMVVQYALQRWERGEEEGSLKTIRGHVDLTSWYAIVAAAVAAAQSVEQPNDSKSGELSTGTELAEGPSVSAWEQTTKGLRELAANPEQPGGYRQLARDAVREGDSLANQLRSAHVRADDLRQTIHNCTVMANGLRQERDVALALLQQLPTADAIAGWIRDGIAAARDAGDPLVPEALAARIVAARPTKPAEGTVTHREGQCRPGDRTFPGQWKLIPGMSETNYCTVCGREVGK